MKSSQVMASDMHRQSFCSTYNIIKISPTTKTPILLLVILYIRHPLPATSTLCMFTLEKASVVLSQLVLSPNKRLSGCIKNPTASSTAVLKVHCNVCNVVGVQPNHPRVPRISSKTKKNHQNPSTFDHFINFFLVAECCYGNGLRN